MLEKETETYAANRAQLLGEHRGHFALVKGDKVVDVFALTMR